jgi:glutamate decarboxylase
MADKAADSAVAQRVRSLFVADEAETEIEARISKSVERFLGATIVSTEVDFDALSADFRATTVPERPGDVAAYLEGLGTRVAAHSIHTASPNYMGHMTSALPYFVRPLSRLITALNQNLVKVETSKALTPYEREALAMMHRLVFARDDAFYGAHVQDKSSTLGIMTSGGTLANATGLWIARNTSLGPDAGFAGVERAGLAAALEHYKARRAVIVGSALMHYSLEKAADLLGIGTEGFVRVPVDPDSRVRLDDMRAAMKACTERGDRVIAVVGIAGTTDSGAIDPLPELAAIAREAKTHLHVDAAWGGPLLFSPEQRSKLAGIELADSVTIDGHKQLYLPMGIGMVLLRNPTIARAIEKQAQYIIRADSPDLGRRALEGSRPGMALYLHAALHVIGASGYAWLVEEGIRKARWMAARLREREEFELLAEPQMNIVNYRYLPVDLRSKARALTLSPDEQIVINQTNERLQEKQRAVGQTFVSRTTLRFTRHGHDLPIAALRAVLANPLTEESHIEAMLEGQVDVGDGLVR